jgi:hypothetical protein
MINNRKLVLDTFCEVYDLLLPYADREFYDFKTHKIIPGAIYLIGRAQFNFNTDAIRKLVEDNVIQVILSNPAEGSETLKDHCTYVHKMADLALDNRILLIGGGDMDPEWPCLQYDSFLPKILDYDENLEAIKQSDEIFSKTQKPYKFLFLNGRIRGHRKYLIEKFNLNNLLDQSIWTCLEMREGTRINLSLMHNGEELMCSTRPAKFLDSKYEVDRYKDRVGMTFEQSYTKYELFDKEWGEIYLKAEPYIDTYFSVVTETVFEYPYSFRTEKIWKPIAMAHPWIVTANMGYYRDIQNLGFKTFGHVIDESFDTISNSQDRLDRISQVVEDLCKQDLAKFLEECYTVCKYNQQHLKEMRDRVRKEFPDRFLQFLKKYERP